jgi:mono/diheme cytochrome c family protein
MSCRVPGLLHVFPELGTFAARLAVVGIMFGSPALAADFRNGERIYGMHCVNCHGPNGVPAMPGAPDLKRGPILLKPDAQLLKGLKSGRGAMPGYAGILKEREFADVIAYLRTLN